jgi:hypothetical protein
LVRKETTAQVNRDNPKKKGGEQGSTAMLVPGMSCVRGGLPKLGENLSRGEHINRPCQNVGATISCRLARQQLRSSVCLGEGADMWSRHDRAGVKRLGRHCGAAEVEQSQLCVAANC